MNCWSEIIERCAAFRANAPQSQAFLTLSFAQSIDGSLAFDIGERSILSSTASFAMSHALRAIHDAVVVGVGTVLIDDPRLTVRHGAETTGAQPKRIILDRHARTPADAALFDPLGGEICIATAEGLADEERCRLLRDAGACVWTWHERDFEPAHLAASLARHGVGSAMIEGGANVLSSFLASDAPDYLVLTLCPLLNLSSGSVRYTVARKTPPLDLSIVARTPVERDLIFHGPWPS